MTIQFSTKIFPQADLHNVKTLKSGLKTLLAQATDCLVLAYSKTDLDGIAGAKAAKTKSGLLAELDQFLSGAVSHAHVLGDLGSAQASICTLRADKSWAANTVKAKRVLLICLGDLHQASETGLYAYSKVARAGLKALSGSSIENAIWFAPSFKQSKSKNAIAQEVRLTIQYAGDQAYRFGEIGRAHV